MYIVLIRTIILYFTVIISMRLMGKKQIGQLEPFELAIAIMISELASLPMQDTRIPLVHGVIPIITLLILQLILSLLDLKSETFRELINGKPSILIEDGKINISELKKQRFNMDDLLEELRMSGFYNLEDIEYAILETSGQVSVIPKTELCSVTREDLNIKCSQDKLPITLISDGKVNYSNLKILNKNISWLNNKLKEYNITDINTVFIAVIDAKGKFYFQKRNG